MMDIKGFIPSSLIEWEGKISAVIFLPGCNLRCRYCHAAHLILHPERLESLSRTQVLDHLRGQEGWLDGVVITGGEPTLHGDELLALIEEIRSIPLEVMVETNGTQPEWVNRLIAGRHVQAFSMDFKAPLTPEDYRRVAGADVDVADVRLSLNLIKQSGLPCELRVTLVPGLVGRAELERMLPDLEGARQVALQNFRPELCLAEELRSVVPFKPDELEELQRLVASVAERVVIRGRDHAALAGSSRQG